MGRRLFYERVRFGCIAAVLKEDQRPTFHLPASHIDRIRIVSANNVPCFQTALQVLLQNENLTRNDGFRLCRC